MRLYLSSKRLGNNPEQLQTLVPANKRHVGIILNAGDDTPQEKQKDRLIRVAARFSEIGFTSEEIDLRNYFGETKVSETDLQRFGLIWVQGGNIFILRRAYKQSGFDKIITKMISDNTIAYGGESAGAVILGQNFLGLDIVDDQKLTPEGYEFEYPATGLGIIDYTIVPHFESENPETPLVEKLHTYLKEKKLPHKTLHDGEVIIYS